MNRPVPLSEASDASLFGGKSASLARALRAGLPVPPGFALDLNTVEAVVAGDPEVVEALRDVLAQLSGPVAVRSSAVGEDERESSFAGQHATLLNIRTHATLVDAIGEVRQSAHSASALAYRAKMGIAGAPKIGVTIQRLVDAEVSGVLFTVNPATGAAERLIEASWGLGEAVVSGLVVPDSYRIDPDGTILERTPGDKDLALRPGGAGGTVETAVASDDARSLALSDAQLMELHHLTLLCEAEYGSRLDMEWAFEKGRLFLLQCRGITA